MNEEEILRLAKVIAEQMGIVSRHPDQLHACGIRLKETFLDANRECIKRIEISAEEEVQMLRAVLKYSHAAKHFDARVAIDRALNGKFETSNDVHEWVQVWDPA